MERRDSSSMTSKYAPTPFKTYAEAAENWVPRSQRRKLEKALGPRPETVTWAAASDKSLPKGRQARKKLLDYQAGFAAIYQETRLEGDGKKRLSGGSYFMRDGNVVAQMTPYGSGNYYWKEGLPYILPIKDRK